ncbi:MAG: complex I NDUFA9 subunit family protein [Phycisphaeraceae bacterium]|nr:complex I NDUFA9 subunit family protein [Phycisphaeraceae bacterium]
MPDAGLNVALTGATGFVGRHVLEALVQRGCRVRALARDPHRLPASGEQVLPVAGDLFDDNALATLVEGTGAVIHIVGIIAEKPRLGQTFPRIHVDATAKLLDHAKKAGVPRWIHMSALGTRPDAVSAYHQTKWQAEQLVRRSGLAWTIFRPSIIHGPDGEFMRMVRQFWCGLMPPFVPYFGKGLLGRGGAGSLQPVWVEDVARCFADAVTLDKTVGETYPLGGPDAVTWPQLYSICKRHLPEARNKRIVAVPAWYANLIAGLPGVPFNRDQVIMSQEDSTCQTAKVEDDFGFKLAAFEPTFAGYAASIA